MEHLWRPDCLRAPMALPAALGRVLRSVRERGQPYLMGTHLAPMQKVLGLESRALTSGLGSATAHCDPLNQSVPLPPIPRLSFSI